MEILHEARHLFAASLAVCLIGLLIAAALLLGGVVWKVSWGLWRLKRLQKLPLRD